MKFKKIIFGVFILGLVFSLANSVQAISLVENIPCAGGNVTENITDTDKTTTAGECTPCDFVKLFVNASNILVGLSGAFAVLMFVFGGIVLITAYGNEGRIQWGKNILIATVMGIFIVMLAWIFINVVTGAVLGVENPITKGWFETGSAEGKRVCD